MPKQVKKKCSGNYDHLSTVLSVIRNHDREYLHSEMSDRLNNKREKKIKEEKEIKINLDSNSM